MIEKQETVGKEFETVDRSIRAILVRKNGSAGAVRVFGEPIKNVVTGPKETGFALITIAAKEECMFLGSPSVRYFRSRGP